MSGCDSLIQQLLNSLFHRYNFLAIFLLQIPNFLKVLLQLVYSRLVVLRLLEGGVWWQAVYTVGIDEILGVALNLLIDILHHVRTEPLYDLAVFPETEFGFTFRRFIIATKTVLLSVGPVTSILSTVNPLEDTVAVFLVVKVLSDIRPTI